METIFNVIGDKKKVDTLIERIKHFSGNRNIIEEVFFENSLKKDINIIAINGESADYIVEFCAECNLTCELI